ncbi:MAG: hypothetical protein ACYDAD_01100 [Acidimicrobiales bacterium]
MADTEGVGAISSADDRGVDGGIARLDGIVGRPDVGARSAVGG